MKRTIKKSTRLDNGYPMCEICKHSRGCRLDPPTCNYDITDREDLKNRIFYAVTMNTKGDNETYPDDVVKEMNTRFLKVYNGKAFEIYNMNFKHEICPDCDGSGVIVDASGILTCKKCDGSGIINIPIKSGYIKAYMVYDSEPNSFDISEVLGIYKSKEQAEGAYAMLFDDAKASDNHIGEIFLSENLDNTEMWRVFHTLFDGDHGCKLTIFDTVHNQVVYAGLGWKQFWHEGFAMDLIGSSNEYYDLSSMTDGRYIMLPASEFENRYQVHDKDFMDELYTAQLSNITSMYLPYVSYGDGTKNKQYELLDRYLERYTSIEIIRNNLKHHIANGCNALDPFVIGDMSEINKIINDFKLIGMNITVSEAAVVVKLIQSLVSQTNYILSAFNTVAVFILEYILISAEYANISD